MVNLSYFGTIAFYFCSMMGNAFDAPLLYHLLKESDRWGLLLVLALSAVASMIAGKMITSLTDQIYRESVQEGNGETLLFHPLEERNPDIDISSVVYEVVGRSTRGKFLTLATMFFSISVTIALGFYTTQFITVPLYFIVLRLQDFSDKSPPDFKEMKYDVAILFAAVIISILNLFTEKQLETTHKIVMICRLATVWLTGPIFIVHLGPRVQPYIPYDKTVLSVVWIFFYHIAIPSTANTSQQSKESHFHTQQLAVGATLCYNVWFWYCTFYGAEWVQGFPDTLTMLLLTLAALVSVASIFANVQIYWKAMSRILMTWICRTGGVSVASSHPRAFLATRMLLHWPFHLFAAVLVVSDIEMFGFLARLFYTVMPVLILGLYATIAVAYLFRKGMIKCSGKTGFQVCITGIALLSYVFYLMSSEWNTAAMVFFASPFLIVVVTVFIVLLLRSCS